jgi:bacterioferritin-associated ferredoxin
MFVCLCKAVTDQDIRSAVESGVSSFEELQNHTDVSTSCGRCVFEAQSIFDEKIAIEASKRGPANATSIVLQAG